MSLLPSDTIVSSSDERTKQEILDYQECFNQFDTAYDSEIGRSSTANNAITVNKLYTMLQSYTGTSYSNEQLQDMIAAIDMNNSGDIQFTEFLTMMNKGQKEEQLKLQRPGSAAIQRTQTQNNRIGSKKSMMTENQQNNSSKTMSKDLIRAIFLSADKDEDGYISIDELKGLFDSEQESYTEEELYVIAYMLMDGQSKGGMISYKAFQKFMLSEENK